MIHPKEISIKLFRLIDNFIIENIKNRNFYILGLTFLFSLPIIIFMAISFFASCSKNNLIRIEYNPYKYDNCYCKTFPSQNSIENYISKTNPILEYQNSQCVPE